MMLSLKAARHVVHLVQGRSRCLGSDFQVNFKLSIIFMISEIKGNPKLRHPFSDILSVKLESKPRT